MARRFYKLATVERWTPYIEAEIKARELQCKIEPGTVLSLIHVESNGLPRARKSSSSQFYGLLQIGKTVAKDTLGHYDSSVFHGDGPASIHAFFDWAERYDHLHQWEPDWIAIGWKAGVKTLQRYLKRKVQKGHSAKKLQAYLHKKWNTDLYLEWFDKAELVWSKG